VDERAGGDEKLRDGALRGAEKLGAGVPRDGVKVRAGALRAGEGLGLWRGTDILGAGTARGAGAGAEKLGALDAGCRSLRTDGTTAREVDRAGCEWVGARQAGVVTGCGRSRTAGREMVSRDGDAGAGRGVSILGAGGWLMDCRGAGSLLAGATDDWREGLSCRLAALLCAVPRSGRSERWMMTGLLGLVAASGLVRMVFGSERGRVIVSEGDPIAGFSVLVANDCPARGWAAAPTSGLGDEPGAARCVEGANVEPTVPLRLSVLVRRFEGEAVTVEEGNCGRETASVPLALSNRSPRFPRAAGLLTG